MDINKDYSKASRYYAGAFVTVLAMIAFIVAWIVYRVFYYHPISYLSVVALFVTVSLGSFMFTYIEWCVRFIHRKFVQ